MGIITYTATVTVTYDEDPARTKEASLKVVSEDQQIDTKLKTNPRFASECYFRAFACGAATIFKNMKELGGIPEDKSMATFIEVCAGYLEGKVYYGDKNEGGLFG